MLCLKIFFFRIIDVSLGTFRTIVTVKGKNILAGIIGFFEVFIWFTIVEEALSKSNSIFVALFYSLGFACGTIIGGYASNYFITTNITLQIITNNNNMASYLREKGFGVTSINVNGKDGIKKLWNEVKSWIDEPKRFFRNYSIDYFQDVMEEKQHE